MSLLSPPVVLLSREEAQARARRIRLVVTDCDGVLTDGGVYYGAGGERLRRFSVRDGMGVERLRTSGIETAILSGERCESIRLRADKLDLKYVHLGIRNKVGRLPELLAEAGLTIEGAAYIGDDVNDLDVMRALEPVGLTAAPADAVPEIADVVHYRCRAAGGHGAFREFAEWILESRRGTWNYRRRDSWQERA